MSSCVWVESKQGIPPIPCEWVKRNYGKEREDWDSLHPCDGVVWRYNNNLWGIDNDYEWLYSGSLDKIMIKSTVTDYSFTLNQQLHKGDSIVLSLTKVSGSINNDPVAFVDMSKTISLDIEAKEDDNVICTPEPNEFVSMDFGVVMVNVKAIYNVNKKNQEILIYLKTPDTYVIDGNLDVYVLKKV